MYKKSGKRVVQILSNLNLVEANKRFPRVTSELEAYEIFMVDHVEKLKLI